MLAEAQEACETYVICSGEHPRRPVGTSGQVVWGQVLLAQLQVDVIGPLPSLEGYKYAITGMDTATGLLAAYPTWHLHQRVVIIALNPLCSPYG